MDFHVLRLNHLDQQRGAKRRLKPSTITSEHQKYMATNNFLVDAIAGARGLTSSSLIGQVSSAPAGNALAILKQQLEKIKTVDTLTDAQRSEKSRLTSAKESNERKGGLVSKLDEELAKLGNLANQLNGLGGLRAEETKKVKVQKEIKGQKNVTTLDNPLGVSEANLSSDKLQLGNADTLFGNSTPNAKVSVEIQVAQGASNVEGLTDKATFTAERVGNSNEIRLLDSGGNLVNIGGTGTGQQKNLTGITVAKSTTSTVETTTIQETEEEKKAANLKKIRETFTAFVDQLKTVKSFISENAKEGGELSGDRGVGQLQGELNRATKQLDGIDADKFVQGLDKSFAQFEKIGRTTAANVANVSSRFSGFGGVLGQELSGVKKQTNDINNQLGRLEDTQKSNREELKSAATDIAKAVLSVGSQKSFLQKIGTDSTAPKKAASAAFSLPKLPGSAPATIGAGTTAAV